MAWILYNQAVTPTFGGMMTLNNPPATPAPANSRSWAPAVPTARQPGTMAASTGSEIALRGDHRAPATIAAAGGLYSHQLGNQALPTVPNAARSAGPMPGSHRGPAVATDFANNPYDPNNHQAFANPSKLVSFTRDIGVAKGFAGHNGYVYLVRVNKGVDYNAFAGGNGMQAEVMAIQGVALRDIIAVRDLSNNNVYINTVFQGASMPQATFLAGMQLLQS